MKFSLNASQEPKEPISERVSQPVTASMKTDIVRIKGSSDRNRTLWNDLSRQFFEQLIEKFDAGEFDDEATA